MNTYAEQHVPFAKYRMSLLIRNYMRLEFSGVQMYFSF